MGMSGAPLDGIDHLRQSVADILTTPIGSRVMLRDYGSRLFQLVDRPMGDDLDLEIFAAVAEALAKWEPRLSLERVWIEQVSPGVLVVGIEGRYAPDGQPVKLDGVKVR